MFVRGRDLKKPFLLFVEEIHEYVPEGGGLDETGKMLIRIAKRGRKRGIGIAGLSQRPADVKKDFITQCDWLLWHRLTWENDLKTVRRVLGSDYVDAVQGLDDGEGFLMADFREADVEQVQVRRKRTFDAGATPTLEDYDRPDLKDVSGDLVAELEEITAQEQQRQDRIAQLEAALEAKEATIEELQADLQQAKDMSNMAEQFTEALTESAGSDDNGSEALQAKIDEIREEKNARISELEAENESLREELDLLRETKQTLEERVDELEEYEQVVENIDELREAARRMHDALDLDTGSDAQLRDRLQRKDDRIEELEATVDRLEEQAGEVTVPDDYQEFVNDPAVQEAIEDAKDQSSASPRYVKGVIATIVEEGGPVDYETIAAYLGVSTTTDVSKASSALQGCGVVEKLSEAPARIDFDMESIADIKQQNQRRERAEQLMDEL